MGYTDGIPNSVHNKQVYQDMCIVAKDHHKTLPPVLDIPVVNAVEESTILDEGGNFGKRPREKEETREWPKRRRV